MSGKKNFKWLWQAEHAANTAIRDSVSSAALRVCFVCACLPAYFRFNRNYPLITKRYRDCNSKIVLLFHTQTIVKVIQNGQFICIYLVYSIVHVYMVYTD